MIEIEPVGYVEARRTAPHDDYWGGSLARITLTDAYAPAALEGLAAFSHAEILYLFDRVGPASVVRGARQPRGTVHQPAWSSELMREYWSAAPAAPR